MCNRKIRRKSTLGHSTRGLYYQLVETLILKFAVNNCDKYDLRQIINQAINQSIKNVSEQMGSIAVTVHQYAKYYIIEHFQ